MERTIFNLKKFISDKQYEYNNPNQVKNETNDQKRNNDNLENNRLSISHKNEVLNTLDNFNNSSEKKDRINSDISNLKENENFHNGGKSSLIYRE